VNLKLKKIKKNSILTVLVLCSIAIFESCEDDFTFFEDKVKNFGIDNTISVKEFQELKVDIEQHSNDRKFNRFLTKRELDEKKIEKYLIDLGYIINQEVKENPSERIINIYIENSGSMDGYITQPSEFKDALRKFTSDIRPNFGLYPGFYFVNDKGAFNQFPDNPTPDYYKFIADLSPNNSKIKYPPGRDSSIDDIINYSTQNMKNKISVVFSDCVLSYKKTGSEGAKTAEANIKDFMAEKIEKQNLSTIVVKFNSRFKGSYYNESNGGIGITVNKNINRPFYALIFGETPSLNYLLSKINFSKYPGYETSYTLIANNKEVKPESIITYKNKIGSFEFVKPASKMKIINAEPIKGNKEFQFSINVNLKNLPFEKDFLLKPLNYSINENYNIKSIDELDKSDKFSHNITLYTNDLKQNANLILGLKYAIPKWVESTGSDIDDKPEDSLQQKQTFGFKYLMTGLSEAYVAKNDTLQFKIPISINKNGANGNNSTKFPWWVFIVIASVLGLLIYFKNKK
jgi:hypothetical protein